MLEQQREYVLRTVEERGVRLVRLWFTDILGNLKSFAISPAELENALEDGMTFDGSSIEGFSRVQEADVLARETVPNTNKGRTPLILHQYVLMCFLREHGPARRRRILARTGIPPGSLGVLLFRCRNNGLLEKDSEARWQIVQRGQDQVA